MEIVRILLKAGAAVHIGSSTPLELATGNGLTEVVNLLLEASNYSGRQKNTKFDDAWFLAICGGHIDIVRSLIAVGADVNRLWSRGSGLHYAIERGQKAIGQLLLASGASVDIRDPDKSGSEWTPRDASRQSSKWRNCRDVDCGWG